LSVDAIRSRLWEREERGESKRGKGFGDKAKFGENRLVHSQQSLIEKSDGKSQCEESKKKG